MLTDRHLRALKPPTHARDFHDIQQRGLIARILPSGIIQFSVRSRFQGQQKRLKLGEYAAVSLQEARKRARDAQASIDDGHDPAGDRHAAKAPRTDTIESLAADYLKKHARKHKRSAHEDKRILDVDVLPHRRGKSVRDLTRRDVRALIDRVADRAPIMANRVLALVPKMLNSPSTRIGSTPIRPRVCRSPHAKCRAIAYSPTTNSAVRIVSALEYRRGTKLVKAASAQRRSASRIRRSRRP